MSRISITQEAAIIATKLSSTLNKHLTETTHNGTTQHWAKELIIGLALLADHLPRETGNTDHDDTQCSHFIDDCRLFKTTYEQHLSTIADTTPYATLTQLLDEALPDPKEEACAQPTELNLGYIESVPTRHTILEKYHNDHDIIAETTTKPKITSSNTRNHKPIVVNYTQEINAKIDALKKDLRNIMSQEDWAVILRDKLLALSIPELTSRSFLSIKQIFHAVIIMASDNELTSTQKNTICNHAELCHIIQAITDFNQKSFLFPNIALSYSQEPSATVESISRSITQTTQKMYLTSTPILKKYAISALESLKQQYEQVGRLPTDLSHFKINRLKQPILDLQAELNQYKLSGNKAQPFFYKKSARKISSARQKRIHYLEALIAAYQTMAQPYEAKDTLTPAELAQFQSDHNAFMAAFIAIKEKHDRSNSSWIHNLGNRNRLGKLLNCVFTSNMIKETKIAHRETPPHFSITASSIVLQTLKNQGLLMNKNGYKTAITKHIVVKQFIPNFNKELYACTTAEDINYLGEKTDLARQLLQESGSITLEKRAELKKTIAHIVNPVLRSLRPVQPKLDTSPTVDPKTSTQAIIENAITSLTQAITDTHMTSQQPSSEPTQASNTTHTENDFGPFQNLQDAQHIQSTQQSLPAESVELSNPDNNPQITTLIKSVITKALTEVIMAKQPAAEVNIPPTAIFDDTPLPTSLINRELSLGQMHPLDRPSDDVTKLRTASFSVRLLAPPKPSTRRHNSELDLSSAPVDLIPLAPNA